MTRHAFESLNVAVVQKAAELRYQIWKELVWPATALTRVAIGSLPTSGNCETPPAFVLVRCF